MAETVPKILEPNPYIKDPYVMSGVILNEEAWLMLDQLSEIPSNSEYPYKKKRKAVIEDLLEEFDEGESDEEKNESAKEKTTNDIYLSNKDLFEKYKKIDEDQQIFKKSSFGGRRTFSKRSHSGA